MSHWISKTGRIYVECDEKVGVGRCGRRTFGRKDSQRTGSAGIAHGIPNRDGGLSIDELPPGWRVAPYPDGFDHYERTGRTWMLGPSSTADVIPQNVRGDLHECPTCARKQQVGRRCPATSEAHGKHYRCRLDSGHGAGHSYVEDAANQVGGLS